MPAAAILVAEDQTDIRDLLVMNLRTAGYEVSAVGDGEQALFLFRSMAGRANHDGFAVLHRPLEQPRRGLWRAEIHDHIAVADIGRQRIAEVDGGANPDSGLLRRASHGLAHAAARSIEKKCESHGAQR